MKKNISINISGIIFHIEEDGYETLRKYLDSINKYFSSFEDSTEIMADIESRIAEIFLGKLNEGKQVITLDDVNGLITTMGSVSDFKAAEETTANGGTTAKPEEPSASTNTNTNTGNSGSSSTYQPPRSFQRDQKRKILGGVCAGLGTYLRVDPLWIRLIFVIFTFSGVSIIAYIVMWIVVPGTYDLPEPDFGKKMFRDPDGKVLGGVSGGIASYFNIETLVVRILFIALTFASGFGIFLYIILWVIIPEARTLTDRMQMQGEPVTLSNIETSIKKNQESSGNAPQESEVAKILLFPFRLLAVVLRAIARVIKPLAEALRIVIGVLIVGTGLTFLITILISAGVALGIFSTGLMDVPWNDYSEIGLPVDAFIRAFPGWTMFAGFLAVLIPSLIVILLGISLIARKIVFSSTVGWTLFVIFLVSIGMLSVGIPKIVMAFKQTGTNEVVTEYTPTGKRAFLKVHEVGMDDYKGITLQLRGYEGKTFKLVKQFKSQGTTRAQALENINMIDYNVTMKDSVFTFDSNVIFKPQSVFRAQELNMILYIPYHYPIVLDETTSWFIDNYIEYDNLNGNTWEMDEKSGLTCVTCPKKDTVVEDLSDFDQIEAHGIFDIRIIPGDSYSVELNGAETEKSKYQITRAGKTLIIDFEGKKNFNWDWNEDKWLSNKVYITITMRELDKLEATGFGSIEFEEFAMDDMEIEIRGPIKVKGKLQTEELMINLTGRSEVYLEGRSNRMNADLALASLLKAYDLEVNEARVEVNGASHAKLNVLHRLEMEEGLASDIDYRGNPEIIKHNNQ
jgi:phage shock protein PspC (stress-responsive transcriptional regulator)